VRVNAIKFFKGARNLYRCKNCDGAFERARDLKLHKRNCRKAGSRYVKASKAGRISCDVCGSTCASREDFNSHVFFNHSDEECVTKYNRRVEDVVNVKATERLRNKLFVMLRHSSIHDVCLGLLPE
jgi:hypothetical protein